jgi:hypothetical protein
MKKLVLALPFLLAFAAVAPQASADTVINTLFNGELQKISDNSGEFLFNRFGPTTDLDPGDILITSFAIDTLEALGPSAPATRSYLGGSGNSEWTGFAALELVSFTANPGVGTGGTFVFAPVSAAGRAAVAANGTMPVTAGILAGMAAGSTIAFFDDGAVHDWTRTGTPDDGDPGHAGTDIGVGPFASEDALIGLSVNGPGLKLFEVGFLGLMGEGWDAATTVGSNSILGVAAGSSSTNFGTVNFFQNITFALPQLKFSRLLPGAPLGFGPLVDFAGNANLQGTRKGTPLAVATPFDIFDDFNAEFVVSVVPEPASMALFGIGSAIMAGYGLRRRNRKTS